MRDEVDFASGIGALLRAQLFRHPACGGEDRRVGVARGVRTAVGGIRERSDLTRLVAELLRGYVGGAATVVGAAADTRDEHDAVTRAAGAVGRRRMVVTVRGLVEVGVQDHACAERRGVDARRRETRERAPDALLVAAGEAARAVGGRGERGRDRVDVVLVDAGRRARDTPDRVDHTATEVAQAFDQSPPLLRHRVAERRARSARGARRSRGRPPRRAASGRGTRRPRADRSGAPGRRGSCRFRHWCRGRRRRGRSGRGAPTRWSGTSTRCGARRHGRRRRGPHRRSCPRR